MRHKALCVDVIEPRTYFKDNFSQILETPKLAFQNGAVIVESPIL